MNYSEATKKLCDLFEDRIVDGELKIQSQSFAEVIMYNFPGFEWQTDGKFGSRYVVAEPVARMLIKLARLDYRFYDLCVDICVCNMDPQSPLPDALSFFTIEVLRGKWLRPRKRGVERKRTWLRDAFLFSHLHSTARVFGLELTRNDASPRISACDAVAEALTVCGCETSFNNLKELLVHSDTKLFRAEMDLVEGVQNDLFGSKAVEDWLRPEAYHILSEFAFLTEEKVKSIRPAHKSSVQKGK
jgi:hypothetical protein